MARRVLISMLALVALAILLLLAADIAYFFRGSLEMFPTDEQEEKVRIVTIAVAVVLGLVESLVLYLLWRVLESKASG